MLLLAFLPAMVPTGNAAVASAIQITVNELYDRADTYTDANGDNVFELTPGAFDGIGYVAIKSNLATTTLYDVNIVFDRDTTTAWTTTDANVAIYNDVPIVGQVTVSIARLTAGGQVNVQYDLPVTTEVPIYMTTSYSRDRIIVANDGADDTEVTLNVIANTAFLNGHNLNEVNVTVTSADRNGDLLPDWTFTDYPGAGGPVSSFVWNIGNMAPTDIATTTYTADPIDTNDFPTTADLVLTGLASSWAKFGVSTTDETLTGVNVVGSPTAGTSNLQLDLTKESVPNNGGGDDWEFTPSIRNTNTEALDYELTSASLWVCALSNLNTVERSQVYGPAPLDATFTAGDVWNGATFNVYDFSGTPVGFLKPVLTIKDVPGVDDQVTQAYNMGFDNTYRIELIQEIYIVNGYYVKVTKTITDVGGNRYQIDLKVENLGNRATPPHIFVYDVVASGWTYDDAADNPGYTGHITVTNTNFPGEAYWWDLASLAASNGVAGGPDETSIQYFVTGSGDYPITDLYLVGLDPSLSDMFQSSPSIENAMTIVNSNIEYVMMIGALGVFAIGMFGTVRRRF